MLNNFESPMLKIQDFLYFDNCLEFRISYFVLALVFALVHELVGGDPRHHAAELLAHDLDLVRGIQAPAPRHLRIVGHAFEDEALCVFAALDVLQRRPHGGAARLVDHFRAGDILAVLGVVRDRVVHVGDAAFIHEIDDELQLVQALEIRHLRSVAGFHQRLEAGLHEFHAAAAKHRLFAEEIGFGLVFKGGFDDAGAAAADGGGIGKRGVLGLAGRVLEYSNQVGNAAALHELAAHRVARGLGGDHDHVQIGARHNLVIVNVETVREGERRPLLQVRRDVVGVDEALMLVRRQHHHQVRLFHRIGDVLHGETRVLRLLDRGRALAQRHRDGDAAVLQVQRMRMALGAIAHDGHLLAADDREISVFVVIELHLFPFLCRIDSIPNSAFGLLPRDRHLARPDELLDAHGLQELDERGDLLLIARHLEGVSLDRGVHHPRPEDVRDPEGLGPVLGQGVDLDQAHFALDELILGQVGHLDDVDELVQLLDDLLEDPLVARGHDGHLGNGRIKRRPDADGLDVEPPSGKQARDPGENAEFVFNQNRDDMFHVDVLSIYHGLTRFKECKTETGLFAFTVFIRGYNYFTAFSFFSSFFFSSPKIISLMDAPAGTMGKTFS